jgi:hypothetical protein
MCWIFSTTFVWNMSLSNNNSDRNYRIYPQLFIKVLLILVIFNETWILSGDFRNNILSYQISWKSVQWQPSCFMRTDGQTGRSYSNNSNNWMQQFHEFITWRFMCRSVCFVRLYAHHQELTTPSATSGFTVGALVVVARPRPTMLLPPTVQR